MMNENRPNAQARLQNMLGTAVFERELLVDRVEELTAQLAKRDEEIKKLKEEAAK